MIRFLPDTWREIFLRPIAMAAPDAGVYIEIMAPDFRFAFALILVVALLFFSFFRSGFRRKSLRPTFALFGVITLSFVPWLATTANGRYFIPLLLTIGPLCIALLWHLPMTKGFRLAFALLIVSLQIFAVQQSNPFNSWGLVQWKTPPFFNIELPQSVANHPATYVTLSNLSYSLIAPLFPAQSRWMNLSYAPSITNDEPGSQLTRKFLEKAEPGKLTLLVPTISEYSTPEGLPNDLMLRTVTARIQKHHLEFQKFETCQKIPLRQRAADIKGKEQPHSTGSETNPGFWICPLRYDPSLPVQTPEQKIGRFDSAFKKIEDHCPRFFPPGQIGSTSIPDGEMRIYDSSERKIYILDNGEIFYKYYRALNPVRIGRIEDVLNGKTKVDCKNIHGRSGLPWERSI